MSVGRLVSSASAAARLSSSTLRHATLRVASRASTRVGRGLFDEFRLSQLRPAQRGGGCAGKERSLPDGGEGFGVVRGGLEPPTFRFSGRQTEAHHLGDDRTCGRWAVMKRGSYSPMLLHQLLHLPLSASPYVPAPTWVCDGWNIRPPEPQT